MALLTHSGTGASDLSALNTKRVDISDILYSSLYFENNMLGITTVGEEFVDQSLVWVEDALNGYKVTDTSGGFTATTVTTMSVSAADAAILDIGYILQQDLKVGASEYIQVTGINGTTITVTRQYGGAGAGAAATTGASVVWRIVNAPTYENSDLGKDMTRARVTKQNWINRFELNVNLSNEQLIRAQRGYAPGVSNELSYQFEQRKKEMLRKVQQAYWFGVPPSSPTGGDYSAMYGLYKWLDGTANTSAATVTSGTFGDTIVNTLVKNILNQGAFPNVLVGPPNAMDDLSKLYSSQIRLTQSDDTRGFFARQFVPTVGGALTLVMDFYLNNTTGTGQVLVLDMDRIRLRPFANSFFFTITAPTFRDGDAVRALSYLSLEVRNTGSDVGQAHWLNSGLTW